MRGATLGAPAIKERASYSGEVRELLTLKDLSEAGTFTGYASVAGKVDLQGEVVDQGAFKRTLKQKGAIRPLLWQHDRDRPIGDVTLEEDERGLKISSGNLDLEISTARDAYAWMRRVASKSIPSGFSIGYRVVKDEWDSDAKVRHLKEIDLWEVSFVTFPANPSARVRTVKAAGDPSAMLRRAAILMGAVKGEQVDPEMEQEVREELERLYHAAGRRAPWEGASSIEELTRHVKELTAFDDESALSPDDAASGDPSQAPFPWPFAAEEPELDPENRKAISSVLSSMQADIAKESR